MIRRVTPLLFAAAGAILLSGTDCSAQNRTGGTTGGFGGTTTGASGFGGSSFGASSFGNSAFGTSGFGQSGFGTGTTGTTTGTGTTGTTTFVGRGSLTTFVGRGSGLQQLNVNAGQQRSNRAGGNTESGSSENRRPDVRVRVTASPELLGRVSPPQLNPRSVSRLQRRGGLEGVAVSTTEGVTVLEGVVATPSQRLLAEKLLAIEPGVGRIENRLRLSSESAGILPSPR